MPTPPKQQFPRGFETFAEAKKRRDRKVRLLNQGNNHQQRQASKLNRCRKKERCESGACDVCVGNFRLRLFRQTLPIFESRPVWTRASVITSGMLKPFDGLLDVDLDAIAKVVDKRLERSSLRNRLVVVGIDISLNLQDNQIIGWQLHLYLLIEGADTLQLREAIKAAFPPEPTAPKPYVFGPVTDFEKAITYLFKATFHRRSRYKNDDGRARTKELPLKGRDLRRLLPFLDRYHIGARLILRGIRRNGRRLVVITK